MGYEKSLAKDDKALLYLIGLYWLVDLARIQNLLPIASLYPGTVIISMMLIALIKRADSICINRHFKLMIVFTTLLWLLVPVADNSRYAFNTALALSLILISCLCIKAYIVTKYNVHQLYSMLFTITFYLSLHTLAHAGRGPGGCVEDENDVALFINTIIPIGLYLWSVNTGAKRWIYLTGSSLMIAAVFATRSRGGFLGLAVMAIFYILRTKRKLIHISFISIVFILFATIISNFTTTATSGRGNYFDGIATMKDTNDNTSQERLWSWVAAFEMFKDNPLGVGGNNFQVRFPEYQPEWFKRSMWGRVAHSVWFTCLAELGFPGITVLFMLLGTNIRTCLNAEASTGEFAGRHNPMTYSIVGFIVSGTFISVLYYPILWIITAILSGMDGAIMLEDKNQAGSVNAMRVSLP
jgi:hypothetical protein